MLVNQISDQIASISQPTNNVKENVVRTDDSVQASKPEVDINYEPVIVENVVDNEKMDAFSEKIEQNISAAIEKINEELRNAGHNISIRVDERTGVFVARIVDKVSGETIKELPPEEILNIKAYIEDRLEGIFLDTKG